MQRVAFKTKLFPGHEAEYTKGHNEIWPELAELLAAFGIRDYSITIRTNSSRGHSRRDGSYTCQISWTPTPTRRRSRSRWPKSFVWTEALGTRMDTLQQ
jgi:hypothetical protein